MMAEASRGAKRKALVQYLDGIEEEDAPTMYRFQVLLPNAVSISLTLNNPGEEMPVRDLLHSVKRELNSAPVGGGKVREIHWDGNIFLTDILDQKITDKIKLSNFDTKSTNILRLQDEKGGFVGTFENMWDLTPQTDLVQELPAEYSTESALVDLTDNALQAVWSNGTGERKLIRITVDKEKIMIFDTGRGMDGSDQNSISKWGTLGSSNHRVFRQKGIGGKAPYLLPFFGMFGYGGTIASMHLGGIAIVNSKTKESGKVFTLHLSRDALLKKTLSKNSKPTWKTAGGVRDPSEEEMTLSPHKSFTQVEIYGLKKHLEVDRLLGFLKDIYFPYIQCDDDTQSMNTRNPVEFEVNDVNLAEVQEGEVTVTNMHSSNGPDFIFHLKFTEIKSASCQAHARLKCVYFPITKGKESIDSILEKLRNDGYEMKENFENFSRVSIRRLGRLLPDARWGPLPFMEAKHRKGHKAEFFRRCCKRVKCFVETDAGFSPTLSKTDLAQHNHFTKALRNWGSKYFNNTSAEVEVEACDKDEKLLSYNQLEKQYYDWIKEMHDKYDVEMDGGDDEPTLIINPKCKERLGISNDVEVIRVHRSITRKGKTWRRGDHLKILPGATGRMKNTFYSLKTSLCTTLEYIVVEGLQGDICGEARLICRPIDYSDEQGCWLDEAGCTSPNIYIQESVSFPVSIIDNRMYKIMDDDSWNQMLKKRKEKAPAWIELIRNSEVDALGLRGDLPYEGDVMAGYRPPHEIVAVLRPGNYTPSSTGLLEQKYIVKDELEMVMEVKQMSRSKDCPAKLVDKKVKKTSLHNDIHGLYVFPLREASWIFKKSGVYQFNFSVSCRDTSVIQKQTTITVCPDLNSRRCLFTGSSTNSDPVNIRLGCPVICLAVKSVDQYGNEIPFLDTSGITITLFDGDDVLAHVDDVEVELASDSLTMNVKDFLFKTSKLDILRPRYEAKLKLSSFDNKLSGIWPCKVKPGLPSTVVMDMSLFLEENLTPGRVIDNFLLEVFDQFSNHVEEGTILDIHVDGLCFLDKKSSVQKVNGEGFIDLRGALRVLGGFGSEACISIFHNGKKIFLQIFQIAIRELKAVNVPESCPAGSFLDIIFEVSDSNGLIDESIDGPLHTLNITSNELPLAEGARYAIKHGRCVVSHVQLPREQGNVTIVACHTHYPDLQITIQLQVQPFDLVLTSFEDGPEPILRDPILSTDSSNLLIPFQVAPAQPSHLVTYVKDVIKKTESKVGDTFSEIESTKKRLVTLYSRKDSLEEEIDTLKGEVGSMVGYFIDAKELIRHKIREKPGTAAFVLCSSECFMDDFVGIVALLGTVPNSKIGKMLAVYLGKDDMLSVVCKTMDAANCIEKYNTDGDVDVGFGIHHEAAALGVPIKSRFSTICLDDIEPFKGGLMRNSPQKELNLTWPFPHVNGPKGFKGFAVNMINLSDENLNITTKGGHGLRETLFYSLFGELQVYETRDDMFRAKDYLNGGAISLDGGIIKGKGKLLLGYSDPKITFPVVSGSMETPGELKGHQDAVTKTRKLDDKVKLLEARKLDDKVKLLEAIKTEISKQEIVYEELLEKFNKRKRKFDEISDKITQPYGNEHVLTPVKAELLDL